MILTASIAFAAAPMSALVVYILMRGNYAWAIEGWNRACAIHRDEERKLLERATDAEKLANTWRRLAIDLQDKIDREAAKRSSITSRGNITRAANRRAKVLEQASKLVADPIRAAA